MTDNSLFTMEQLKPVLDNAPIAIYITATDNWELLYINRLAREFLGCRQDRRTITCYEAAGFSQPCPFCRVHKMTRTESLDREFQHPVTGHIFQLSGKIIDWGDREAHIEYILDITEKKQQEARTEALSRELQETFRSIPSGLSVYRFDGKKISPVFHNPAFYEIMGYSQEHIRSVEQETSFLGVHPDDLAPLRAKIWNIVQNGGVMQHIYRVWNDRKQEYRWLHLDGSVRTMADGTKTLYGVYNDVSDRQLLEKELISANTRMQDIINAIPGGVAIYKVSDIFETVYFSDGVPELSGYTVEEYRKFAKDDASEMTYWEDTAMVVGNLRRAIETHTKADFEFRKSHRDGHIVWVHIQARQIGEEDGYPLLQCVFHNISALKEAQHELDHLVNSIPGGIASYRIEGGKFIPTFFSEGMISLIGYSKEECEELVRDHPGTVIYEPDRARVAAATKAAVLSGEALDITCRMIHKDGSLIWIHLNGRRMGPLSDVMGFYAVFTGMSEETRLFQGIADGTADGIYVIDKESYELLYANESKNLFLNKPHLAGQKCYETLHDRKGPCEFCTLKCHEPDGDEHEFKVDGTDKYYTSRFVETDWNGIPAYVQYIRDVTEEVNTRLEKERLDIYFQTIIKNLPGGVSVIRCETDGTMTPEFISEGFAAMTQMTVEEASVHYKKDIFAGVHPEDRDGIHEKLRQYIGSGDGHGDFTFRLKQSDGTYIWVKVMLTVLQAIEGVRRLYCVYTDITKTVEEREQLHRQYEDIILQHYRTPGPDTLILGHCNITKSIILEIDDYTDSDLLKNFGTDREDFFTSIAGLVVDERDRQKFLDTYLNAPALAAFERNDTEQILNCFIKLPKETKGRYVQFKVNLVAAPDTGDVTGILTVTDITEQIISDKIMQQLSANSYDFVIDLDLLQDTYTVLTYNKHTVCSLEAHGCHSSHVADMSRKVVVPKDRQKYTDGLDPDKMRRRLEEEGAYTFSFSVVSDNGDIHTMNMNVSAVDLRLGRICLARTDITESMREQQGLLNMVAYTFDLAGVIHISSGRLTMYTRQMVLENLPPYVIERYDDSIMNIAHSYGIEEETAEVAEQFRLETMLQRLAGKPEGYDIVFPYRTETGMMYKQTSILWGDENHSTICIVRADVTDMLTAERQTKNALEKALIQAEKANQAKSEFLSAMSHDIRTPMNAIMGMTTLAAAHLDDRSRVADCLQKISISSRHLLSLINDVLDMSKLDGSRIALNRMNLFWPDLIRQLTAIIEPEARKSGLRFHVDCKSIRHEYVYGDTLRINQILINILSNAVKFTPEGGQVDFLVEEIPSVRRPEYIRYRFTIGDTGIGMPEDFMEHIFSPFARSSAAAPIEGTGLGLSITKGLIDLMDGEITVESRLNEGSVFRVELEFEPAQPCMTAGPDNLRISSDSVLETEFAGRVFLVAEDNAINAEILCELLAMHGAKSVLKTDGGQAVEEFRESESGTYDAILMDIQMPVIDGYEAARRIRALDRPDASSIPIVAMTANAFAEDIQKAFDAGMNAHVAKPIDIGVLRETLRKALEHGRRPVR